MRAAQTNLRAAPPPEEQTGKTTHAARHVDYPCTSRKSQKKHTGQ
ncbi:hypothetical protein A2U01_0085369, partial [Trifolium medium]|nr:hypothetical protein [Trifolium medium]